MEPIIKLTIEHLAPYLPYKLKWIFQGDDTIHEVVGLDMTVEGLHLFSPDGSFGRCSFDQGKPLLRRPENVSKEELIESGLDCLMVTGIGKYNITREYSDDDINRYDIHHFGEDTDIPYDVIKILFSLHVDVFGLIESGLAIDVNTIEL